MRFMESVSLTTAVSAKASTGRDDHKVSTGGGGRIGEEVEVGDGWSLNADHVEDESEEFKCIGWVQPIYKLLANIFSNLFNIVTMPAIEVPNYQLKAINPYRRVPLPPLPTDTETGLICKSKSCKQRPTHLTVYFKSQHKHLIGVKCPIDDAFIRTYNSKHFQDQLRAVNRRVIDPSAGTMDLDRLMHAPPTPPATQPATGTSNRAEGRPAGASATAGIDRECKGIGGKIASGHQPRKNDKCAANACKSCCLKLNTSGRHPCNKHNSMAKRQQKEIKDHGRVSIISSLPTRNLSDFAASSSVADPDHESSGSLAITQASRSKGVKKYKGRVQTDFLDEYRTMTLQQESAARRRTVQHKTASRTIALVVWAGPKVHAASWPDFALKESLDMKALVVEQLGPEWKGNLQVWNEENQLWLHTSMDILVTYPVNTRKILVVFPQIKPEDCHDVDRHLASVSTGGKTGAMTMCAFIQRKSSATPQGKAKGKGKGRVITLRSSSEPEHRQSPPHVKSNLPAQGLQFDNVGGTPGPSKSRQPPEKRARSPSLEISKVDYPATPDKSSSQQATRRRQPQWSKSATMDEMLRLYKLTLDGPNKHDNQEAFVAVFGTRFRYVISTISHYCRWCEALDKRLKPFVDRHGDMKVADARKHHFNAEWRKTDSRFDDQPPPKRVKLNRA
ncbi:uncharacterized protein MELLADRAFT_101881 [Melampsora larici-populina 98AG31]|uniref:Uncharacterized protein n=1 Tax=Melampsora larici-populina (strain 98AG31 / pathotype 3-4-7) TaxID=747676 RepID=F4R581_MELLP|nr:uncharacterized protein MELLADRAFT_101881 [Melampsora larici-populina 98AG31]EGG12001.1 hypothetical protein MELLADRAFT_101881 [Melampsora larici-populina 98AG31]